MKYFQTWKWAAKLMLIPFVGRWLYSFAQWTCGRLSGHEPSKTEWGYAGGGEAEVWCRWCNKYGRIPISDLEKRFPESRRLIHEKTGKDIRNGPIDLG